MEEKVEEFLRRKADGEGADLTFPPHRPHHESSFFEYFILRGVKFHSLQHDSFSCSFQVPPRLTDENGNLAVGAISALVDEIGAAAIHREGLAMDVSVDMSISYLSPAKVHVWRCQLWSYLFVECVDWLEHLKGVNRMSKEEF
ncbi:uncharacterized protein [Primulina eburnea]|uniref:uncharacterized protein isoform X2 n=1 Tax=Primulina eburnea TaxID=1245227 RepID=UPI003C6C3A78